MLDNKVGCCHTLSHLMVTPLWLTGVAHDNREVSRKQKAVCLPGVKLQHGPEQQPGLWTAKGGVEHCDVYHSCPSCQQA